MTNFADRTKKDLLATAKERNITGRHDMTKEDLVAALEADAAEAERIAREIEEAELAEMMAAEQAKIDAESNAAAEVKLAGKPNGKEMQAIAKGWTGTRKEFLEYVVKAGANPNSAAWHWQQGRN